MFNSKTISYLIHQSLLKVQLSTVVLTDTVVSQSESLAFQASFSFEFAQVSIGGTVCCTDRFVVHLAGDLADWHFGLNAFAGVLNSNRLLLQAGRRLELAFVTVRDSIGTANWIAVELTSHVARCIFLRALSNVLDGDASSLHAGGGLEVAQVGVCHGIGSTDRAVVHLTGDAAAETASINASTIVLDSDVLLLQTSVGFQLTEISVGASVSAADWSVVHGTGDITRICTGDGNEQQDEKHFCD
jgi:hypothetical protein